MLNLRSAGLVCLLFVLTALSAMPAKAQTYIYNTTADGNWTSNATWQNGATGKPPVSGNCNCIININPGHRLTINQSININNARIILLGDGSELRFGSEILGAQTMQLNGTSNIELRHAGANIQSTSNFFGYNGNAISINGTVVFQGYSTRVNSSTRGVVAGPASASSAMSTPAFINALLPVKLTEFSAHEYRGLVQLQWKTAEEKNFDHFEIEKSLNGTDWSPAGIIKGNMKGIYSFTDPSPANGANYYRLKMADIDAAFEYSRVVAVNISVSDDYVKVYPNPATSVVFVTHLPPGAHHIEAINRYGQVVLKRKLFAAGNSISLDVRQLEHGIYFLCIFNATGARMQKPTMICRSR